MEITAAVLRAKSQPLAIEHLELKELGENEVIVRITSTGICHTDIACQEQIMPVPLPIVLGHEGAGIVEKVGKSVKKVAPNDRVVLSMDSCGICPMCLENKIWWCLNGLYVNFGIQIGPSSPVTKFQPYISDVMGGFLGQSSFASHVLTKDKCVVKVRSDAPTHLLGPFGCSILTGAGTVIQALKVPPGASIAIIGTGAVGLNSVLAAHLSGCSTIIAIDVLEERLNIAHAAGATHTINAKKDTISKSIRDILPNGVDYVIDTTAMNENIVQAIDALIKSGTLALVGVGPNDRQLNVNMMTLFTKGIRIHSICAGEAIADTFIPKMVDLFMQGKYPFEKFLTFYHFNDIQKAIEDQRKGKIIKAVIKF